MHILDFDFKSADGRKLRVLSSTTYQRQTNKMYKEKTPRIREYIRDAQYVCTTADVWTSRHRRFMGVTVSWVISYYYILYVIYCLGITIENLYWSFFI